VAEDAESTGRVTKGSGDLLRGAAIDIEGPESFVLALLGVLRFEEKGVRIC